MKRFMDILRDENGQGMVEYGLILGLIALVAIGAVVFLGEGVDSIFTGAKAKLDTVPGLGGTEE
jgi:pilus assembly protein Flp/PilA